MSSPQRVLILTGLFLIACTMAFGVWYAIFDEHQTLVGMGVHMATFFYVGRNLADVLAVFDDRIARIQVLKRNLVADGHIGPDGHLERGIVMRDDT